jgi:hypothetical protein
LFALGTSSRPEIKIPPTYTRPRRRELVRAGNWELGTGNLLSFRPFLGKHGMDATYEGNAGVIILMLTLLNPLARD